MILDYSDEYAFILTENQTIGKFISKTPFWAREYINVDELGDEIEDFFDIFNVGDVILAQVNDISFAAGEDDICDIFDFFDEIAEDDSSSYCQFNHEIF